jgi:restriction system protein
MAIPDFQSLMLPALRYVANKTGDVPVREISEVLSKEFNLTDEDLNKLLPSGRAPQFYNRVQWAITHLRKAGLFATPRRACVSITQRGREVLAKKPKRVDMRLLSEFPEFQQFRSKKADEDEDSENNGAASGKTPLEILESGHQSLRSALATDLLDRVRNCTPSFFERMVIELLLKMGYGGSRTDAGKALGRSGDGGIDGIIKEDRLGLDTIYTQAKRWTDKPVGRPEVQQFQGALAGHGAGKGIFITTSYFTKEAIDYAAGLRNSKIVLIDGEELAELMIDHGIGVATAATYEVKRIDSDYFAEGEE